MRRRARSRCSADRGSPAACASPRSTARRSRARRAVEIVPVIEHADLRARLRDDVERHRAAARVWISRRKWNAPYSTPTSLNSRRSRWPACRSTRDAADHVALGVRRARASSGSAAIAGELRGVPNSTAPSRAGRVRPRGWPCRTARREPTLQLAFRPPRASAIRTPDDQLPDLGRRAPGTPRRRPRDIAAISHIRLRPPRATNRRRRRDRPTTRRYFIAALDFDERVESIVNANASLAPVGPGEID